MTISKPGWRAIALVAAGTFFLLATRDDVFRATSPRSLAHTLFGSEIIHFSPPWWLSLHIWVRKAYSIVAFTIVGFCANRALEASARPALRAAAIVAAYSLGIEVAQHVFVTAEPPLESILDVGCGALGGWLAVLADRIISEKNQTRKDDAAKRRTQPLRSRNY